jgi:hypothetical protein
VIKLDKLAAAMTLLQPLPRDLCGSENTHPKYRAPSRRITLIRFRREWELPPDSFHVRKRVKLKSNVSNVKRASQAIAIWMPLSENKSS